MAPRTPFPGVSVNRAVRSWSVTARGLAAVEVRGRNWVVALGRGLDALGRAETLERLACEVLPNGTVIARDVASGIGYVVQALGEVNAEVEGALDDLTADAGDFLSETSDLTAEAPMPLPPDASELFGASESVEEAAAVEYLEDTHGQPIFELPLDAIAAVPDDDPGIPVLDAESRVQACNLALATARRQVDAESGAVLLEERGVLRFVAVDGPHSRKLLGTRLPVGTGVAGFSMERKRLVVLSDARVDPRHCQEVDAITGYTTRQIAVVPVVHDDQALGVLELMNLPEGRRFAEADLAIVRQIADALAVRLSR